MRREETISLGEFRQRFKDFHDETNVFFGCPDEANPLEFVGVETEGNDTLMVRFRLHVYKGADSLAQR